MNIADLINLDPAALAKALVALVGAVGSVVGGVALVRRVRARRLEIRDERKAK